MGGDKLHSIIKRPKKRVGRGIGSGKGGHTSGRGQKGQKARGSVGILFEGYKMKKTFLKRLPFLRGKGKFLPKGSPAIVKYADLSGLPNGSKIDVKLLLKNGFVTQKEVKRFGVKVLGVGKNEKKFEFLVPVSKINA